jgi:cob(I)alamin adenosyltransferase
MSIATKTGDRGETGLLFGVRVSKADLRISAVGDVDELCAAIGLIKPLLHASDPTLAPVIYILSNIQQKLTLLMGELSTEPEHLDTYVNKYGSINEENLTNLEKDLDVLEASVPKQKDWVLYGATVLGAQADFASKVCRRAERAMCRLDYHKERTLVFKYINRLSDYLHLLARWFDNAPTDIRIAEETLNTEENEKQSE